MASAGENALGPPAGGGRTALILPGGGARGAYQAGDKSLLDTALRESADGFYIAERDLELRGPGEVLGTRQTGLMEFRVAELPAHEGLLDEVQALAQRIQRDHPALADPLIRRWTGTRDRFADV